MPRPKLHSDEAILDGAKAVLKRDGPADFTLQAVALEVGISRAALIQRFKNKENLLRCVMDRAVKLTREHLDALPVERSNEGLRGFLRELCDVLGSGQGFESNLLIAWQEARDPELRRLSRERLQLVQDAIAKRVPDSCRMAPADAAELLQMVIGGAAMHWMVRGDGDLSEYVERRLERTLAGLLIPPAT